MPTPPTLPLALGAPVPDCALPDGSRLADHRGQPLVLAFAATEWDPATAYQSTLFARLVQEFDTGAAFVDVPAPADTWLALDADSAVAARFGVRGQRALVVLDEQGRLRWQLTVAPGQPIQAGQVLAALEALRPIPAAEPASRTEAPGATPGSGLSRRTFLTATLAASALLLLLSTGAAAEAAAPPAAPTATLPSADDTVPLTLRINGQSHRLQVEPRVMLLDALREQLHLTGTKKGCDHGQCGACTVHIDGQSALACLTLAVMSEGRAITTIEGLARGEELHPMQAAFLKHDAFQCGYCTPGQIMAATALVQDRQPRSAADIREAMSGNLCRCAAYANIIAAIQEAQRA